MIAKAVGTPSQMCRHESDLADHRWSVIRVTIVWTGQHTGRWCLECTRFDGEEHPKCRLSILVSGCTGGGIQHASAPSCFFLSHWFWGIGLIICSDADIRRISSTSRLCGSYTSISICCRRTPCISREPLCNTASIPSSHTDLTCGVFQMCPSWDLLYPGRYWSWGKERRYSRCWWRSWHGPWHYLPF